MNRTPVLMQHYCKHISDMGSHLLGSTKFFQFKTGIYRVLCGALENCFALANNLNSNAHLVFILPAQLWLILSKVHGYDCVSVLPHNVEHPFGTKFQAAHLKSSLAALSLTLRSMGLNQRCNWNYLRNFKKYIYACLIPTPSWTHDLEKYMYMVQNC